MNITLLEKTKGSDDPYGDPTLTWKAYTIKASSFHPLGRVERATTDIGKFRAAQYHVTFKWDTTYVAKVVAGNRIIYNSEQYKILLREDWLDRCGNVIRVYALVEKCTDTVSYT